MLFMKKYLNASAVPYQYKCCRHDHLPDFSFGQSVSTSTEYTTAREVVDNAVPAISEASVSVKAKLCIKKKLR